jgi:GABA permease
MESGRPTRILVVANRTVVAPRLLDEIRRRALRGPCAFTLLIPDVGRRGRHDWRLDTALPLLRRAAGRSTVDGFVAGPEPFPAVQEAVAGGDFDEIIVSTLPGGASRWLRRDLVHRIESLGLPVTHVMPRSSRLSNREAFDTLLDVGVAAGVGLAAPRPRPGDREGEPPE